MELGSNSDVIIHCVRIGKSCNPLRSKLQFPHLQNGNDNADNTGLLWRLNERFYVHY